MAFCRGRLARYGRHLYHLVGTPESDPVAVRIGLRDVGWLIASHADEPAVHLAFRDLTDPVVRRQHRRRFLPVRDKQHGSTAPDVMRRAHSRIDSAFGYAAPVGPAHAPIDLIKR